MRVDLHLHTVASDGLWIVENVYQYVRASNVDLFSVTDHDLPQTLDVPEDLRDRYVPGVEVDCALADRTVHLLLYGAIDPDAPLVQLLVEQRQRRFERTCQILARLWEIDIHIDVRDVVRNAGEGNRSLGRPHIARTLVQHGAVKTLTTAFNRYLAEDRPAYVPLKRLSADEVIDLGHAAGCVVMVAHPSRLIGDGDLDTLCRLGVDGFEVRHPQLSLEQSETLAHLASARGLLQCAGSDYHGGSAPSPYELKFETVKQFHNALHQARVNGDAPLDTRADGALLGVVRQAHHDTAAAQDGNAKSERKLHGSYF